MMVNPLLNHNRVVYASLMALQRPWNIQLAFATLTVQ